MRRIYNVVGLALCVAMAACGGGGAAGPVAAPNAVPIANAGARQYVATGTLVSLTAAGSTDADGDLLTYSWSLRAEQAGSAATLSNPTSATPTFTTDTDPRGTSYVATLVVNDGKTSSVPVTVNIAATSPGVAILEIGIGGTETLGTLPYGRNRTQTINSNQPVATVATFKLVAQGSDFTVQGLSLEGAPSCCTPSFGSLVNGQVIPAGQPVTFTLQSTYTRGSQVFYKYKFEIAELPGETFVYDVALTTN